MMLQSNFISRPLEEEALSLHKNNTLLKSDKGGKKWLYSSKEANKGSVAIVREIKDYLSEVNKQLDDKDVYQELRRDVQFPLDKVIKKALRKLGNRDDISHETLDYVSFNNPELGTFNLLPKIQKGLRDVPGKSCYFKLWFLYRKCFLICWVSPCPSSKVLYQRYKQLFYVSYLTFLLCLRNYKEVQNIAKESCWCFEKCFAFQYYTKYRLKQYILQPHQFDALVFSITFNGEY